MPVIKRPLKYSLIMVFALLSLISCSNHSNSKKVPIFYLKNNLKSKIDVTIKGRKDECSFNKLSSSKTLELGQAFFIDKIAIYNHNNDKTYLFNPGFKLLPFYHWGFIYDWKVYLGFDDDKYIYLLEEREVDKYVYSPVNKFHIDKDNQPKGKSDNGFPMRYYKVIDGSISCQDYNREIRGRRL